jgi:tRNA A37 N6-isopentenylltransferase MiaA
VLELAGIRNVLAKSLGTTNPINMAKATVNALQRLRRPEDVARIRGKQISEVLPVGAKRDEVAAEAGVIPAAGAVPTARTAEQVVEKVEDSVSGKGEEQ